ncbi:MAG: ABC transporter ATP-binding protein [Rhodomicrobium sp.]|nr:ABC transporter ATP-binding protein [Rhodomicrobium sp.]
MRGGRLVQSGTAQNLYDNPADIYVAETFSEMNLVPCRVISGWAVGPLGRFRAPPGLEGEVTLCLRPREIELAPASGGTPARVLEARPIGREAIVELGVKGLEKSVIIRTQGASLPEKGAELSIGVKPESVLIFPRREDSSPL